MSILPGIMRALTSLIILVSAAVAENRFEGNQRKNYKIFPEEHSLTPKKAAVAALKPGFEFQLEGEAGSRQHWVLPLNLRFSSDASFHLKLNSDNLRSVGDKPNVYLMLRHHQHAGREIKVPLFKSHGGKARFQNQIDIPHNLGLYKIEALHIDLYLDKTGTGSLKLHNWHIEMADNMLPSERVEQILKQPPSNEARLAQLPSGRLQFMLNGKAASLDNFAPGIWTPALQKQAKESTLNRLYLPVWKLWQQPGYFDFLALEEQLRLSTADGASLILSLDLSRPPTWFKDDVSDLSKAWPELCRKAIRQIMAHIRKSPWERHLIAIKLIAGEKNNQLALTKRDESTAYKQAFQAWLKGKYRNLEALNKAWKTTLTDFDKALPLLRNEWPQGKMGYLADPENRHFIDSRLFYNESWAAYLNNLAASVKQYSHGRYLSISSNGPFALMSAHRQVQYSLAPAAFRKLLASPAFDVIEIDRDLMNLPLFAPLLRKHKKALMIHDADFPNREEADFFRKAALASGVYFSEIRKIPQFSENEMLLRKLPPASKAEIAIVIDPDSFLWSLPWSGESPGLQQAARAHYQFALPLQLAYEYGFPIDLKLINDPDLKNYKCLIFHHIPHLEDKFRKQLTELKSGERVLVFSAAFGLVTDKPYDFPAQLKAIGVQTAFFRPGSWQLTPATDLRTFLKVPRLTRPFAIQSSPYAGGRGPELKQLRFIIRDKSAKALGSYQDGPPALALRKNDNWTALYSASPVINPEFIRILAKDASLNPILHQPERALITSKFVILQPKFARIQILRFQKAVPLTEISTKSSFPAKKVHSFQAKTGQSLLLFKGTAQELESLGE